MSFALDTIAQKLAAYRPLQVRGDHMLNPGFAPKPPYRRAAVLIPLLQRENDLHVLFTLRTAHLHAHAGQVSFPGGGADKEDADEVATALREAHEEIGLAPENVNVIGILDNYITRTGYQVRPVVGLVTPPDKWVMDEFEVAEIFEVPLSHIVCDGNLCIHTVNDENLERRYYACHWQDHRIWGATAGMLQNFIEAISHG